jgi:hypothetical protein
LPRRCLQRRRAAALLAAAPVEVATERRTATIRRPAALEAGAPPALRARVVRQQATELATQAQPAAEAQLRMQAPRAEAALPIAAAPGLRPFLVP